MSMPRLLTILGLLIASAASAANLQIPSGHPRLWFGNATRLAQAQAYFVATPFTPAGGDIQFERALRGLLTASNADCDAASVSWHHDGRRVSARVWRHFDDHGGTRATLPDCGGDRTGIAWGIY